jgi:predicted enzyme related to lactoylglutathione lyase
MTTRDTSFAPGTPCWVDLMTSDVEQSKTFYGTLFGWEFEDSGAEYGNYVTARKDGKNVAGLMQKPADSPAPDAWSTYIGTADLDATLAAVADAGGQVVMPQMQVGEQGRMAVVSDPAGAVIVFWEPGAHTGFQRYNEPGTITWDELHSKDFAAATPFYEAVCGWDYDRMSDTDEFRYFTAKVDGETVAGLMDSASFLPEQVPSHWALYLAVEDCDEEVARAVELGAQVLRAAEDTPFGRIADLVDTGGVGFKLHSQKLANPPAEGGE